MREYFAFCVGNNQNSGLKATRDEAEQWAKKKLNEMANVAQVIICETIATVEREVTPIVVRNIPSDLEDAFAAEVSQVSKAA